MIAPEVTLERLSSRVKEWLADARRYRHERNDNMFKLMLWCIKEAKLENRKARGKIKKSKER